VADTGQEPLTPAPPRAPFLARFIATFGFSGFFPWAPATFASLIVAVLYLLLPPLGVAAQGVLLVLVTWVGVITSTLAEKELGLDAHPIVIDEVAGMIVTFLFVPLSGSLVHRAALIGAGFLLFRAYDIFKPWPVDRLQRLPGGRGIVADDLLAGVYANLSLRILLLLGFSRWVSGGPPR